VQGIIAELLMDVSGLRKLPRVHAIFVAIPDAVLMETQTLFAVRFIALDATRLS